MTAISLDSGFIRTHDKETLRRRLRRILGSVRFELVEHEHAFRILGPDMNYHDADPNLSKGLKEFKRDMTVEELASYRSRERLYDLCCEDCWSGYFIADQLNCYADQDEIVLIHLDDHTDMMPTLLLFSEGGLSDPTSGWAFHPSRQGDWEAAIESGGVSIGNFITPLYYADQKLHVRHLNNFTTSTYRLFNVTCAPRRYRLIPEIEFATIRKKTGDWQNSAGTYLGGQRADKVLEDIPQGHVIVHIDLDYFINDYNGNVGSTSPTANSESRYQAGRKLKRFFEALKRTTPRVERWIIATSPGFCSVTHWDWLLQQIEHRIEQFDAV